MKTTHNRPLVLLTSLLFTVLLVMQGNAQTEKEKSAFNENVIVTSSYNPVVQEVYKLHENPSITDTVHTVEAFNYDIAPRPYKTTLTVLPIKAARVLGEPISKLYNTYVKAGLGTYYTGCLDIAHFSSRSRNTLYNLSLKHYGSLGQIKDYGNSSFFDTELRAYGKRIWKPFAIDGDVFFTRHKNYYYGYRKNDLNIPYIEAYDDILDYATVWNMVGMNAQYASTYTDNDFLHHNLHVGLYNLHGKGGTNEFNFNVKVNLNKYFSLFGDNQQQLGIALHYDHYIDQFQLGANPYNLFNPYAQVASFETKSNGGIFNASPFIQFQYKKFELEGRLDFTAGIEQRSHFHVYPIVRARLPLISNMLSLYGGMGGGLKKNNLQDLRQQNPYIGPYNHLPFTDHRFEMHAGIQASPYSNFDFLAQCRYAKINQMPFFLIDSLSILHNVYSPIYDNVHQWNIHSELSYRYQNILHLNARFDYYAHSTTTLNAPYHRPAIETAVNIAYHIAHKAIIEFNPTFYGTCKGWDGTQEVTLKPRIDLNLNLTYNYSTQLAFFARMNNLAFQRYYIYTNYPSQKGMIMLGGIYAF